MEENWENKIPIIESNCNVKFSLVHLLYTSNSHYTFCSFCSHHKYMEVINDPGGSTAPLRYITHGSLKEKNNKEDGKLQCFLFFSFLFFFFQKEGRCFASYTDIAAQGLDFPAIHWMVQLNWTQDANTYIHSAGS